MDMNILIRTFHTVRTENIHADDRHLLSVELLSFHVEDVNFSRISATHWWIKLFYNIILKIRVFNMCIFMEQWSFSFIILVLMWVNIK
jgi:hypothetical protein